MKALYVMIDWTIEGLMGLGLPSTEIWVMTWPWDPGKEGDEDVVEPDDEVEGGEAE